MIYVDGATNMPRLISLGWMVLESEGGPAACREPLLRHILLLATLLWNRIRAFWGITVRQGVFAVPVTILIPTEIIILLSLD